MKKFNLKLMVLGMITLGLTACHIDGDVLLGKNNGPYSPGSGFSSVESQPSYPSCGESGASWRLTTQDAVQNGCASSELRGKLATAQLNDGGVLVITLRPLRPDVYPILTAVHLMGRSPLNTYDLEMDLACATLDGGARVECRYDSSVSGAGLHPRGDQSRDTAIVVDRLTLQNPDCGTTVTYDVASSGYCWPSSEVALDGTMFPTFYYY